jgi:glycosyltransferase involved in cell wall biosynthesis
MRILQLAPIWETVPPPAYGGTETVVSTLTEELVRRGHDVTLCASGDSDTSANLFSVYERSLRPAGLGPTALQYSLMHAALSLREARGHDIIHNHTGPPSELGMALSCLTDVPMLTTLHNELTEESRYIWSNYTGWYNAISAAQERVLPRLPRARSAGVVHNGIDVDSFPFQPAKDDYVLFIGRIVKDKAPHLAVAAARQAGARIVLAGKVSTDEEHDYYENVIKPLIDGCNVEFVGEADAKLKRELYAGARALLVPLQWDEPFGLVMIEAMACGTPVIAFPRGAAPEIVVEGRNGFFARDVEEMASLLRRVDEIDAADCRQHVEDHFGPGSLADAYLAIYEKMLAAEERLE